MHTVQICCNKQHAGCELNTMDIKDKNNHQHTASCKATLQVMLHIMILKHAPNLEGATVLKCHFSRTLQIFKVVN